MSAVTGQPIPQGRYVAAVRDGDRIHTAGMTPRRDGRLIQTGRVHAGQDLDHWREATRLCAANALAAARARLNGGERIGALLSMTVYIATEPDFAQHAALADFASDYLYEELGQAGIGSRAAVGVYTLPGGAPVEIALVVAVARD